MGPETEIAGILYTPMNPALAAMAGVAAGFFLGALLWHSFPRLPRLGTTFGLAAVGAGLFALENESHNARLQEEAATRAAALVDPETKTWLEPSPAGGVTMEVCPARGGEEFALNTAQTREIRAILEKARTPSDPETMRKNEEAEAGWLEKTMKGSTSGGAPL